MPEEVVYVLGTPGSNTVKIGRTANLPKRVADIQRMSPVPLTVLWTHPGGSELESRLHRHFASQRSHGEWFTFTSGDPVPQIKAAVAAAPWAKPPQVPIAHEVVQPKPRRVSQSEFAVMLEAAERSVRVDHDTSALRSALSARLSEVESIPDLSERFEGARDLRAEISEGERAFLAMEREAVAELKASGLTWRQIGQLLRMSGARAEQIAKAA
ncbi:GIY-YIG nuclease family protein [Streptomyces sp. AHA2]|uniref:GIY-YIG nuclease family protein n=1 Tax=Streptomyces sp. AHA2 TaxID=3064526 RepID=UPI002FDFEB6E